MSTTTHKEQKLAKGDPSQVSSHFIETHMKQLRTLPTTGVFVPNCVGIQSGKVPSLIDRGIIRRVGSYHKQSESGQPTRGEPQYVYEVTPSAAVVIESHDVHQNAQLPCGHSGFENVVDSEYIKCKTCAGRWTSDEVREYRDG